MNEQPEQDGLERNNYTLLRSDIAKLKEMAAERFPREGRADSRMLREIIREAYERWKADRAKEAT